MALDDFHYELPTDAGGEGLEGFAVEAGDRRLGRVAALNRTPAGLVLLVDDSKSYRPVDARLVAGIDLGSEVVVLSPEGEQALAAAAPVQPRQSRPEPPQLVRHLPPDLDPLVTATARARSSSPLWAVGALLVVVAGVTVLPVHFLVERDVGGPARWAWIALPLLVLGLAVWMLSKAADADSSGRMTRSDKLAHVPSFLLGISPRTKKRR